MGKITKIALLNSVLTSLYIILVGSFMYYGGSVKIGNSNTFLIPIAFLMLFVFSAALTGFLIFGKPAQLYIDGKKSEALSLVFQTLAFLCAVTITALLILLFFSR